MRCASDISSTPVGDSVIDAPRTSTDDSSGTGQLLSLVSALVGCGGPNGFVASKLVVGVPDSIVIDDVPWPKKFGVCYYCIVLDRVAAHEGGAPTVL